MLASRRAGLPGRSLPTCRADRRRSTLWSRGAQGRKAEHRACDQACRVRAPPPRRCRHRPTHDAVGSTAGEDALQTPRTAGVVVVPPPEMMTHLGQRHVQRQPWLQRRGSQCRTWARYTPLGFQSAPGAIAIISRGLWVVHLANLREGVEVDGASCGMTPFFAEDLDGGYLETCREFSASDDRGSIAEGARADPTARRRRSHWILLMVKNVKNVMGCWAAGSPSAAMTSNSARKITLNLWHASSQDCICAACTCICSIRLLAYSQR